MQPTVFSFLLSILEIVKLSRFIYTLWRKTSTKMEILLITLVVDSYTNVKQIQHVQQADKRHVILNNSKSNEPQHFCILMRL